MCELEKDFMIISQQFASQVLLINTITVDPIFYCGFDQFVETLCA